MQKVVIALALGLMLVSVGIWEAYATHIPISGQTRYGGSALGNVKVTAERVGEYRYTFSDLNTGNYSVGVDTTNPYSVSGSKAGYQYQGYSNINGGSTLNVIIPNARSFVDIIFKVAYDTSTNVTLQQAQAATVAAEPQFRTEHSIDFKETLSSAAWTSAGAGTNCVTQLHPEAIADTNWTSGNYGNADILIAFTAVNMANGVQGCANQPSSGGTHPATVININTADLGFVVMHEISHNYGLAHTGTCTNQIPNVMATDANDVMCTNGAALRNWSPTQDSTLENRRSWY